MKEQRILEADHFLVVKNAEGAVDRTPQQHKGNAENQCERRNDEKTPWLCPLLKNPDVE